MTFGRTPLPVTVDRSELRIGDHVRNKASGFDYHGRITALPGTERTVKVRYRDGSGKSRNEYWPINHIERAL